MGSNEKHEGQKHEGYQPEGRTVARLTKSRRNALLAQASELAESRATTWRVYQTDTKGNALVNPRLVNASSAEQAAKKVRRSTKARPALTSSEWRAIYQEVGL